MKMTYNEDIYDDPLNFHTSADTHPKHLALCSADTTNPEEVKALKSCPFFDWEGDYEDCDPNIYCKHCWALGDFSVCDNNPK